MMSEVAARRSRRSRCWTRAAALTLATLVAVGCTISPPSTPAPTTRLTGSVVTATSAAQERSTVSISPPAGATAELSCEQPIPSDDPPPADWTVVLDVVALPASPIANSLQVTESGQTANPKLFAKTGLMIRDGASFSIQVAPEYADRAKIGWGSPGPTAARLAAESCRAPTRPASGWLALPGGYYVDQPTCLPIIVSSGGRSRQVNIGVGTTCPGQQLVTVPS